jgi:hypothetical protein
MNLSPIPSSLLEVHEFHGQGYQPLINSTAWRVSLLNFTPSLLPDQIVRFQRHNETDEVFVLLQGRCILFLGQGVSTVTRIFAQDMIPLTLYNIKKGIWHSHALSPDAKLLIVENADTSPVNSPRLQLSLEQQEEIRELARRLWGAYG